MKTVILSVLMSPVFRNLMVKAALVILEHFSKRSDNKLDDELLTIVKNAVNNVDISENESGVK